MRISQIVKHIIIINCIIFFGTSFFGNQYFFDRIFALYYPMSGSFEYWQIITHMFMHGNFSHLLFNMVALWMFGTAVEQMYGQRKFLFFYFSCGFGAVGLTFLVYNFQIYPIVNSLGSEGLSYNLIRDITNLNIIDGQNYSGELLYDRMFSVLESYGKTYSFISSNSFKLLFDLNVMSNGAMVGASGAIMGVLVAFGMLNPNAELMFILFPIPIKAKYFIPGIILFDLFSAITGVAIFSPSNTAFVAHIGGALTGFIIMYFWKKNQFDKFRWN
jgi:membrane associated rhomboid family serine protease